MGIVAHEEKTAKTSRCLPRETIDSPITVIDQTLQEKSEADRKTKVTERERKRKGKRIFWVIYCRFLWFPKKIERKTRLTIPDGELIVVAYWAKVKDSDKEKEEFWRCLSKLIMTISSDRACELKSARRFDGSSIFCRYDRVLKASDLSQRSSRNDHQMNGAFLFSCTKKKWFISCC